MINHTRTLLLNKRYTYGVDEIGYEYIPEDYAPVTLTGSLHHVHNTLLPIAQDAFTHHLIVNTLLNILHHPELLQYTLGIDSRYTYDCDTDKYNQALNRRVYVTRYQSNGCDMTMYYQIKSGNIRALRPGAHKWRLSTGNASSVKVTNNGESALYNIISDTTATETDRLALVDNYLEVYFSIPSNQLTGNYSYDFKLYKAYDLSVNTLLDNVKRYFAYGANYRDIFGNTGDYASTLSDLSTIYQNADEYVLKLGALVLAVVYKINSLRS